MNQSFSISGLSCEACVKLMRRKLEKIDNIGQINIDLKASKLDIDSEHQFNASELNNALAGSDYTVSQ